MTEIIIHKFLQYVNDRYSTLEEVLSDYQNIIDEYMKTCPPTTQSENTFTSFYFTYPELSELKIYSYTDKSCVIIGDSKPVKEKLKELGARWCKCLAQDPFIGQSGWIISKTKLTKNEK